MPTIAFADKSDTILFMEIILQRAVSEFLPSIDQEGEVSGDTLVVAFFVGIKVTVKDAAKARLELIRAF